MLRISLLFTLLVSANFVYANCKVPSTLENLTIISSTDPTYSSVNPNAGDVYRVLYAKDKYTAKLLNKNQPDYKGEYSYSVLDDVNGVGLFTGHEGLPLKKPTHTILFKCVTDDSGTAIFTQTPGINEPKSRQNTVRYFILR